MAQERRYPMGKVEYLSGNEKLELMEEYQTMGRKYGFDAAEDAARHDLLEKLSEWDHEKGLPSDEYLHEDLYEMFDPLFHEDEYLSMHDWNHGVPNEFNEAYFKGFKQGIMDFIMKK
jgi:hypothetical protein